MKKKLISLVLAFILSLSLLPSPAIAADSDFAIEDGVLTKYNGSGGDVTIPSGVTIIANAFERCGSLTNVTIPSGVTIIGASAFEHCTNLTSVSIPSSVIAIEMFAFFDTNLIDVYYAGSESQWNSILVSGGNDSAFDAATIHYNSNGSIAITNTTPITPDIGDDFTLPVEWLDDVTDTDSAIKAVNDLVSIMTDMQKTSPVCTDLASLFAETAAAKPASKVTEGNDILVDAAAITELGNIASQTSAAVETALENGGVTTARELFATAVLVTDKTGITVRIDPDVLTTEVDKVRVETPTYALTFKLSDLAPDLTQTLTFTAKSAVTGSTAPSTTVSSFSDSEFTTISMSILANTAVPVVEIDMPGGKTTNSITVSLPSDGGDTTYRTVATSDGTATASKYNPATTMMDGKVNTSGTYTVKSNEKDFTDIADKSAEMQKAIRYLASKGIINGTTPTTFSPDGSINRAEIATLLVKALGKLDSTATASFSDVTKGNWFYTAAASSQRHKLINGYEDNTFRGTTNINKVQIVAVSSRVLTSEMNYKTPSNPSSYLGKYSDSIATWAQSEVALATKENLVVYRTDGTFSGDKTMTRGDAAIIIYRLFQRIW